MDQKANVGKTISAVQEKQTPHCRGKERDERSTSALLCSRLPMNIMMGLNRGDRYAENVGPIETCTIRSWSDMTSGSKGVALVAARRNKEAASFSETRALVTGPPPAAGIHRRQGIGKGGILIL